MKKKYIEPQMIVEDFTVSEMVAADCVIPESELKVVSQMSDAGCDSGAEGEYWADGKRHDNWWDYTGKPSGKGDVYQAFSELYAGEQDLDGKPENGMEYAFTRAYADANGNSLGVCSFVPSENEITFGFGLVCNDDTSAIQKS